MDALRVDWIDRVRIAHSSFYFHDPREDSVMNQEPKSSREASARKGGEAVSQDREHMADIGRKGGEAPHDTRGRQSGPDAP